MPGYRNNFVGELTEQHYDNVAAELETDVATVELAWVQSRPGVTSTFIAARRV